MVGRGVFIRWGTVVLLVIIGILFSVSSLNAEITGVNIPGIDDERNYFPLYDTAKYQQQELILSEAGAENCYVKRPYGYVASSKITKVNLSIVDTYVDRKSKNEAYIKGTIKNLDDKTIDVLVITFNLFNANGEQIDNAYVSIDYLGGKKTWKFSTDPITRSDFQFERYASIYAGIFQ